MFRTTRCEVPGLGEVLGDVPHGEVRGPGTVVGVGRIRTVESEGHVPHGEVRGLGMEGDRVEFRTGRCEVQAPQKVSGGSEHRTPKGIWVVGKCGTVHPKGTGWLVSASEGSALAGARFRHRGRCGGRSLVIGEENVIWY